MNIEVHIFFSNHTSPLIYVKEWDLQDHVELHFLTFKEPPYCSPLVAAPIYIRVRRLFFLHILSSIYYL